MGFLKELFGINESKEDDIKDIEKSIEKFTDEKLIDLYFKSKASSITFSGTHS